MYIFPPPVQGCAGDPPFPRHQRTFFFSDFFVTRLAVGAVRSHASVVEGAKQVFATARPGGFF